MNEAVASQPRPADAVKGLHKMDVADDALDRIRAQIIDLLANDAENQHVGMDGTITGILIAAVYETPGDDGFVGVHTIQALDPSDRAMIDELRALPDDDPDSDEDRDDVSDIIARMSAGGAVITKMTSVIKNTLHEAIRSYMRFRFMRERLGKLDDDE